MQESANLQEALEEIFNKTTVGFNVKLNADKIQLYLDYGVNKKVLGANVVEGSLEQADFDEDLNAKLDTIYPNQERITTLEDRCTNIEEVKADKTDVENKYVELKNRIAAEEDRAVAYDNKLQVGLDNEIQRAATMEVELAKTINDETSRAISVETANKEELQKHINNEEASRILEDNNLSARINEEISRAEAAETLIQSNLDVEIKRATAVETKETSERKDGDKLLQGQIDAINAKSDVVDVVGTKQELIDYIKPLTENDIVKVLKDESREGATTYYRCSGKDEATSKYIWIFIGTQGPYYTQAESDDRFVNRNVTINGKALTSNIRLSHSDLDDNPVIGDARITITKNNQEVNSFRLNDTTDTTVNIYVPTKLSEFTDDLGSNPTHTHSQYDTIANVDNRVKDLNALIDLKADKSTTYTKTDVDALLKTEGDARIASDSALQEAKQDNLVAGDNITLKDNVISAKDTYYYPGNGVTFDHYSGHTDAYSISLDTSLVDVGFANLTGNPGDSAALKSVLDTKATKVELNTQVSAINKDITAINTSIDNLEKSKVEDVQVVYIPDTQGISIVTGNVATLDISAYDLITSREAAVKEVQDSLDSEIKRASSAETELAGDLSSEIARAKEIESKLSSDLADEASSREAAEAKLQTAISDEASSREAAINNLNNSKVDKVTGKELSTNDFTDTLKSKLDGIESGATNLTVSVENEVIIVTSL